MFISWGWLCQANSGQTAPLSTPTFVSCWRTDPLPMGIYFHRRFFLQLIKMMETMDHEILITTLRMKNH